MLEWKTAFLVLPFFPFLQRSPLLPSSLCRALCQPGGSIPPLLSNVRVSVTFSLLLLHSAILLPPPSTIFSRSRKPPFPRGLLGERKLRSFFFRPPQHPPPSSPHFPKLLWTRLLLWWPPLLRILPLRRVDLPPP